MGYRGEDGSGRKAGQGLGTFAQARGPAALPQEGGEHRQAEAAHRGGPQVGELQAQPHDGQPAEEDCRSALEAVVPEPGEAADEAGTQRHYQAIQHLNCHMCLIRLLLCHAMPCDAIAGARHCFREKSDCR